MSRIVGNVQVAAAVLLALISVALISSSRALADEYASRPITLIVPYPPGGGVDTIARVMSAKLSVALGQQIVIENRPGAGAVIGTRAAAKAPADGYTLVMLATGFTLPANTGYDAKDFAPIGTIASTPIVVMAHPSAPVNSLADVIALAKKDPGKYSYASGSSSAIVSGATFARLAGIDLLHVPYKSSPPALTDLIAGRVSMMFIDVPTGLPHVNAKALKALAVTTKRPSALLPHLPTMDATVKGFDITSWQGYLGPANLPKDMVVKLNAEIRKVVERPDIKSQLAERGMEAFSGPPEEFDAFVKDQLKVWEKLITEAGIEKQ